MKKKILGFACAMLVIGWTDSSKGGGDNTPASGVITNADGPSTNAMSSSAAHPQAWRVYPATPPLASTVSTTNTTTVVIVGTTNASVTTAPPAAKTPPAPGSADPDPDTIQSAPSLQGTQASPGPI